MIAVLQGAYYLATGLWAIVHYPSFARVTGHKTDIWLVKTIGLLLAGIGLVLLVFRHTPTGALLGAITALTLAGVDTFYALRGTIAKVYLGDAAIELAFAVAWLAAVL